MLSHYMHKVASKNNSSQNRNFFHCFFSTQQLSELSNWSYIYSSSFSRSPSLCFYFSLQNVILSSQSAANVKKDTLAQPALEVLETSSQESSLESESEDEDDYMDIWTLNMSSESSSEATFLIRVAAANHWRFLLFFYSAFTLPYARFFRERALSDPGTCVFLCLGSSAAKHGLCRSVVVFSSCSILRSDIFTSVAFKANHNKTVGS